MKGRWPLLLLLAASVAVNGVLLARPAAVALPAAPCASAVVDAGSAVVPVEHHFVWPPVPPPTRADGGTTIAHALPSGPVDATLQQDVLCTVAEEKLRQGWRKDRDETAANLRRSLADEGEQLRNIADNARRIAEVIDLEPERREVLTVRYRQRRLARVDEAIAALGKQPPDYDGLYAAARGLFADEDALALEFGGEAGRERLRIDDLEGRTTFLAIAAAMADAPFESLSW